MSVSQDIYQTSCTMFVHKLLFLILLTVASTNKILVKNPETGEIWYGGEKMDVSRVNFHEINGHTYYINNGTTMPWLDASQLCQILEMTQMSLETQQENEAVTSYILANIISTGFGYWTSGFYLVDSWFWTGTGQEFSYTDWYTGQPDGYLTNLNVAVTTEMRYAGKWWDKTIDRLQGVACE